MALLDRIAAEIQDINNQIQQIQALATRQIQDLNQKKADLVKVQTKLQVMDPQTLVSLENTLFDLSK